MTCRSEIIQRICDLGYPVGIEPGLANSAHPNSRYIVSVGPHRESGNTVQLALFAAVSQAYVTAMSEKEKCITKAEELKKLRDGVCNDK